MWTKPILKVVPMIQRGSSVPPSRTPPAHNVPLFRPLKMKSDSLIENEVPLMEKARSSFVLWRLSARQLVWREKEDLRARVHVEA